MRKKALIIVDHGSAVEEANDTLAKIVGLIESSAKNPFDIVKYCHMELAEPTVAQAFDVLKVNNNSGSETQKLERELLAAWLNFANGAFDLTELVDTDGDRTADTPFATVLANAEAVHGGASTDADRLAQRNILQRINGR